jgi:hypothetical protein
VGQACRRTTGGEPWLGTDAAPGFADTPPLGGAGGLSFVTGPDGRLRGVLHAYAGDGAFPTSPRAAWAYRVEAVGGPRAYRLVAERGNRSPALSVKRP